MTLRLLSKSTLLGALASLAAAGLAAGATPEASVPADGPLAHPPSAHQPWPGEELAGGATTIYDDTASAFGRALHNLDRSRWLAMRAGKRFFENPWQPPEAAPATAPRRGLGPLYNATACADCHFRDGRGGPPPASARSQPGTPEPTLAPLLAKLSRPSGELADGPDPIYGIQLNDHGTGTVPPEGRLVVDYEPVETVDGRVLLRPLTHVADLARGPLDPRTRISLRIPPTLVGLGLLEAVPDAEIEALADPDDRDGDGISGRAQRIATGSGTGSGTEAATRVGRFGWKAGQPTIEGQVAKAFSQDLGVTSPLHPEPNCPAGERACRAALAKAGDEGHVELAGYDLERVVLYVRLLAPPARRDWQDGEVLTGRDDFMAVGCGACHRPQLQTAPAGSPRSAAPADPGGNGGTGQALLPELTGQTIRPYTDLLLHDMGPGLDDGVAEEGATSSEWRTAPLWGLGLLKRINGHMRLLHDGRARSFEEAILWHGGEAEAAREAYRRLPEDQKAALLRFLGSL